MTEGDGRGSDAAADDGLPTGAGGYPTQHPKKFWENLALGWVVIAVGIRGLLQNEDSPMATDPPGWAFLLVKANLAHLVLVPTVLLIGVAVAHLVPARIRGPIQFGLVLTGVMVLYAYPFVRRYGRSNGDG